MQQARRANADVIGAINCVAGNSVLVPKLNAASASPQMMAISFVFEFPARAFMAPPIDSIRDIFAVVMLNASKLMI